MKVTFSGALSLALLSLVILPSSATAARVKVASVSASSEYPADDSGSYDAKRIADGKVSTAWVEGEDRNGLGASITLDLGGEHTVARVKFWGGMWYSTQYWDYSSRPTEVELTFSDGSTELVQLANEMIAQDHTLAKPVKTSTVKITLKNVKSGSTFSDTGISEVQVYDTTPDKMATVASVTASSTAKSDADGSYDPANLVDGISDSMWCAGKPGNGESIEMKFSSKRSVSTLVVNNGIGTSLKYFMKGNRLGKATLTFGDGSTESITVKNSMLPQKISFAPRTTDSVTIVMDDVVKGKEFDDLCLSEAYFTE